MKIKKRATENTTTNDPSKKNKYINGKTQKRKMAKLHLEHTQEITRCQEIIKTKRSQKALLEQELEKAKHVKWINKDIIKEEINSIDNTITKNTTWIKHLRSANQHITKVLEIFNSEQTGSSGPTKGQTDKQNQKQTDGQTTVNKISHTITISDDDAQKMPKNTVSSLDAITESSDEDPERDELIRAAEARQELKTATKRVIKHPDATDATTDANDATTDATTDANDATTDATTDANDATTDTTTDATEATTDATTDTNTMVTPSSSKTTTYAKKTGLSEADMKIINEKIERYEALFAKTRPEATQAITKRNETTTRNAFYNHGQRKQTRQYPPPRIYDCRRRKTIQIIIKEEQ